MSYRPQRYNGSIRILNSVTTSGAKKVLSIHKEKKHGKRIHIKAIPLDRNRTHHEIREYRVKVKSY